MTRTITTAAELDALPVKAVLLDEGGWPVWRDPHEGWCASNGTRGIPADLLVADGAPLTVLHDPSVVPEAAVEAAALAVRKERAFSAAAAFGVPMDDVPQCAEMIARTALTAALPLLTAAPSATRDEVARALEGEFGCFLARDPHRPDAFWGGAADALLARFNITPKEDR